MTSICASRSIVNKLESVVYTNSYDIIAVSETWLTNEIYGNEILHSVYRYYRPSRGGGVMLAFHSNIPCQILESPTDIEVICVELNSQHPIICCVIYIPPNSTSSYHDTLFSFLATVGHYLSDNDIVHLLLLGDLLALNGIPCLANLMYPNHFVT